WTRPAPIACGPWSLRAGRPCDDVAIGPAMIDAHLPPGGRFSIDGPLPRKDQAEEGGGWRFGFSQVSGGSLVEICSQRTKKHQTSRYGAPSAVTSSGRSNSGAATAVLNRTGEGSHGHSDRARGRFHPEGKCNW